MSILETFYILFKSDASDVKKGAEEARQSTEKLQNSLTGISKAGERVGESFLGIANRLAGIAAGFISVNAIMTGLSEAKNHAIELGTLSKVLGVNVSDLDAWSNAVVRAGGTAAGFQSSLRNLGHVFGGSPALALKILPQLADTFQRIGRLRSVYYGKMLGLDEGTILLLQQGRREVEAIIEKQKELGVLNEKAIAVTDKYRIASGELSIAFRSLYTALDITLLPVLTKVYDKIVPIVEYLRDHSNLVIGAFIGIGAAAAVMLAPFIIAQAPLLLLIAGVATLIGLFALGYEDVQAYLNGHKSLIGYILNKWPLAKDVIQDVFRVMRTEIELILHPFKTLISLFEKLKSYFGGNNKLTLDIQNGQALLGQASASGFNSQTSTSIFGARANNQSLTVGDVTIQTQATDAGGIAQDFKTQLSKHFWQSNSTFDDGVAI